jgi:hypothetical protein
MIYWAAARHLSSAPAGTLSPRGGGDRFASTSDQYIVGKRRVSHGATVVGFMSSLVNPFDNWWLQVRSGLPHLFSAIDPLNTVRSATDYGVQIFEVRKERGFSASA